jgi:hypothetical protein
MKKLRPSSQYLSERRQRKWLARLAKLRARRYLENLAEALVVPYESPAISMLAAQNPTVDVPRRPARLDVEIPKTFSVFDNASQSLGAAARLARAARHASFEEVFFDHSRMATVDLAAESVLDFIALEVDRESRSRRQRGTAFGGKFPTDPALVRYLRAIGIIRSLGVRNAYLPPGHRRGVRVFYARSHKHLRPSVAGAPDHKETVIKAFVDHFDRCLRDNDRTLTQEGRMRLGHYTGEILANAEDHSGMRDWTIAGYLDNAREGHRCEIAIFNFGRTISETLQDVPVDSPVYRDITPYVEEHARKSLFGAEWTRENLLTLVALQGHISSKNVRPGIDRGQGTVDLIHFFQQVHDECGTDKAAAQMAIMSGQTHIKFDGKYKMRLSRGRQVIAFNASNDLGLPPDLKYITNLSVAFPGTVISIAFPLAGRNVAALEEAA